MPIKINSVNVDEKYSPILEPNLYTNNWLIPGVTCSNQYEEKAGGIMIPKLASSGKKAPTTPGQKLEHEDAANELIAATFNNEYGYSKKIDDVVAASVAYPIAEAAQQDNVKSARESVQSSALACAISEGAVSADTEASTKENAIDQLIDARKEISEKKGTASIVLASPKFYANLTASALNKMTPVTNDKIVTTGQVKELLGFTVFEVNDFANGDATYINHAGQMITVTAEDLAKVDFIMYDPRVFSWITLLQGMRMKDHPDYFATFAQLQIDCGYRITTPECMLVKKHA